MRHIEQTKQLMNALQMQVELYDFCVECIKRLYPEDQDLMISYFDDGIEAYDWNCCIQTLRCLDANLQNHKKGMEKTK